MGVVVPPYSRRVSSIRAVNELGFGLASSLGAAYCLAGESTGSRLLMDRVRIAQLHKLGAVYGGVGFAEDDQNLHCQFCAESKQLMQVV